MNEISIALDAFMVDLFCWHRDKLPRSILKHLTKTIDYNIVPDRVISDNQDVRELVKWERIEKMKLIRILVRCIDQDVEDIDKFEVYLRKLDYKVKDLSHLLKRQPEYIKYFNIDLNKITTSEAARLLSFGHEYFLDKVDFSKYRFNYKESMNIIQGYKYDRDIIKKVNYKSLKGYQIAEILIHTNEVNLDLFDVGKLTSIDWLNLLEERENMLKICNFSKFKTGDIFYSIRLCCMFEAPDLSYLILDRDLEEVSPFGWEKLLIEKPDIFLEHCNFSKLDENNWKNILEEHPQLDVYKI